MKLREVRGVECFEVLYRVLAGVLVTAAISVISGVATAAPIKVELRISGQDCAIVNADGSYSGGTSAFDSCGVFKMSNGGPIVEISPVIAKYEAGSTSADAINSSQFPTIDGSEFAIDYGNGKTGSFTYNAGANDPGVRYWSVKAANGFLLQFYGDTSVCSSSADMSLECLASAAVINPGQSYAWTTGVKNGISHITFFDSVNPTIVTSEPGLIGLFGLGLAALGFAARRRA